MREEPDYSGQWTEVWIQPGVYTDFSKRKNRRRLLLALPRSWWRRLVWRIQDWLER